MSKRESKAIILKSLEELGDYFEYADSAAERIEDGADGSAALSAVHDETKPTPVAATTDLTVLLAQLQEANASLGRVIQQDQAARERARGLLDRYDASQRDMGEGQQALSNARAVRQRAEALHAEALEDAARDAAGAIAAIAAQAETAASQFMEARRTALEELAAHPLVHRLIEERQRQEEQRRQDEAEAELTRQRADGLAAVQAALAAGHLEEARTLLGPLVRDYPNDAEIASVADSIRRREDLVKHAAADEALRAARCTYRREPTTAIALLERLDVAGLPDALARQIKGVWAAACARLCQERQVTGLLRYLPAPAYGVVVAREEAGAYRVVSALGPTHLERGALVDETFASRARPLRSSGR